MPCRCGYEVIGYADCQPVAQAESQRRGAAPAKCADLSCASRAWRLGAVSRLAPTLALMRVFLLAFLWLLCADLASAAPAVVSSVVAVVSGGYWSAAGRTGTYRVVVANEGTEHVISRVFIEWLAESPEGMTVVASVEPQLPFGNGTANLRATLRPLRTNRVLIQVAGVISADPTQKARAVVLAGVPGRVAVGRVNRSVKTDAQGHRPLHSPVSLVAAYLQR